jgi:hypothetical protein
MKKKSSEITASPKMERKQTVTLTIGPKTMEVLLAYKAYVNKATRTEVTVTNCASAALGAGLEKIRELLNLGGEVITSCYD